MCGIVAALGWNAEIDTERVARGLDAIAHRGPDGRGIWTSEDRRVALGHVRLAVRDIEGGAQPIASEDGRVVAVVNGEIYATESLRRELTARGHVFRARTDSEIVVHAWEEWGPAMLSHLHGELAIALWDARDRVLFASRDRFGVKPLAWAKHAGHLLLASRVRGLFGMGLPAAWDAGSLFQSASLQYGPRDATLFAGAHEIPAGCMLLATGSGIRIREHSDIAAKPTRRTPREPREARDAVRELGARLDDAVRARLEADVPCAFQLSGGLDSSAVLASGARHMGRTVDAFTVSFTDAAAYDEGDRAAVIARHVGANLHVVNVADREIADSFADAVVHAEGACINAHAAAKLRLSAAIRDAGYKVVLTGEGADEVLFGYAHLRADLDGSIRRIASANAASAGLMLPDGDGISTAAIARALGFVPTWIAAKAAFGKRVRDLARDAWLASFGDRDSARVMLAEFDVPGRLHGRERVEQSAYLWSKLALEGYILRALGDGLEMANGIEGRLPFLDSSLVDFVASLPTDMKIREGIEKWVLREAVRDRLPSDVVMREKHPFLAPPMGPRMHALARDVLTSAAFRAQPAFDPRKVEALLDALPSMTADERKAYDPVVFFVLSIAILHARFGVTS